MFSSLIARREAVYDEKAIPDCGAKSHAGRLLITFSALFAFGASCGFLLETIYRSTAEHQLIKPGFLHGPCVPIYGFGFALIYVMNCIRVPFVKNAKARFFLSVLLQTLAAGALEFFTGLFYLQRYGIRHWDYTGYFGNIMGVICPSFLLAWAALCAVYSLFLHPYIRRGLHAFLSSGICIFFLGGYVGILLIDLALSFAAIAP